MYVGALGLVLSFIMVLIYALVAFMRTIVGEIVNRM